MRLGKDAIIFTKCASSMSVGMLSQTYLEKTGAKDILVPIITWDLNGTTLLVLKPLLQKLCVSSVDVRLILAKDAG